MSDFLSAFNAFNGFGGTPMPIDMSEFMVNANSIKYALSYHAAQAEKAGLNTSIKTRTLPDELSDPDFLRDICIYEVRRNPETGEYSKKTRDLAHISLRDGLSKTVIKNHVLGTTTEILFGEISSVSKTDQVIEQILQCSFNRREREAMRIVNRCNSNTLNKDLRVIDAHFISRLLPGLTH